MWAASLAHVSHKSYPFLGWCPFFQREHTLCVPFAICYLLFAQRCASRETALIDAAAINAAGTFLILL